MKKMCYTGMLVFLFICLTACSPDMPKGPEPPEAKKFMPREEVVEAAGGVRETSTSFAVKHKVAGNDVYFECIVTEASFRNNGIKMFLYMNGEKIKEAAQSAFIVKGLPQGKHELQLKLVKGDTEEMIAEEKIVLEIK